MNAIAKLLVMALVALAAWKPKPKPKRTLH